MFKIQTLNAISSTGLEQFPQAHYHIGSDMASPDAILVRSHVMHDMTIPSSVKVVGRAGAGVNNIPIAAFTKRGIPVLNTPGANANAVRELVLAGMLLASRHICRAWHYVNQLPEQDNDALHHAIEQHKKQFVGTELMGKTLGVIGLGSIGVKVANAAVYLGMDVIGYDPTITVNRAWELSANVEQAHDIANVLNKADFISFHVPLTPETKKMINVAAIQKMKANVVLLNFARDGIIDHDALLSAFNEKKVGTYVTDFPDQLFKNHPQVIALPHLGASTKEAEENCALMIVKQVRDFLENGSISHSVNFPSLSVPKLISGTRLAMVNANIPNMVAQISAKLAAAELNITSLLNKSRDEIAYTVVDLATDVSPQVLEKMASIEGVMHLRKIDVS